MNVSAAYVECERLARTAAANFYPAFLVLPRERRRAMYALYAFNRQTDDIADGAGELIAKQNGLAKWRATLDSVLAGNADHPTLTALRDTAQRFAIPHQYFHAVIDGCRLDITPQPFPVFADLYRYCYLVASAVGLSCIHVWGFRGEHAIAYAESAGVALQLTNILRDLGEDRARGRVYLPVEDLDRFGCDRGKVCDDIDCPSFQSLMRFQTARAKQYYDHARGLFDCLDPAGRAVFSVLLGTYRKLLDRIETGGFDVFRQRVRVPRREKLALLARSLPVRWGWARA